MTASAINVNDVESDENESAEAVSAKTNADVPIGEPKNAPRYARHLTTSGRLLASSQFLKGR